MFSSQRVNNTVETESLTTSSVICLDYTGGGRKYRQDYLQNDYNLMKMQLLQRIAMKRAVLKIFSWSK